VIHPDQALARTPVDHTDGQRTASWPPLSRQQSLKDTDGTGSSRAEKATALASQRCPVDSLKRHTDCVAVLSA
jgi:hypothetical protein